MAPIKFGIGQSVLRKEDDALIRGRGRYTDDHAPQASMHALVLRSPHAHAKFTLDASRARGLPGVATILTAEDVKDLGGLPCLFNLEVNPFKGPPYAILAHGVVRHVGDAVAFVVAETIDQARDAIEAIDVEWTQLAAVVGVANAVKKGAPQVMPAMCCLTFRSATRRRPRRHSRQPMRSPKYRSSIRAWLPISWKRARWFANMTRGAII
jgi:carbon-monoxide dehydrogenase large subunit